VLIHESNIFAKGMEVQFFGEIQDSKNDEFELEDV
jgi:hypothetical protein